MTKNPNQKSLDLQYRIIKRSVFCILRFIIIIFYFGSRTSTNLLESLIALLVILPIWFFRDRQIKDANLQSMITRIRYCRPDYKRRSILSIVVFTFLFFGSLIPIIGNIQEEKKATKERFAYINAATPTIKIISKEGNVGDATGYNLIYTTQNATEVIVNGETIELQGEERKENSINYSLEGSGNRRLEILIVARNEYKRSEKKIEVTRNKTKEETDEYNKEILRIEGERIVIVTDRIDGYIKEMNDGYNFYDVPTINKTIANFRLLWRVIEGNINSESKKIAKKAQEAKSKLIATQKLVFPKLRKEWCTLSDETMWEYDVDVKCSGTTVKFIGGIYAANSNIRDSYSAVSDMLKMLRFKKANFYWYEGSEYTYYTINSLNDGALD